MSIVKIITQLMSKLYVYCTDFTINLANLTGTSYYEVNFFFFCVLFPFLLVALPAIAIFLKLKVKRMKNRINLDVK